MQRKYLHKDESENEPDIDPMAEYKRRINLKRQPSENVSEESSFLQNTVRSVIADVGQQATQQTERGIDQSRIANIKKSRFTDNLKFLQGNSTLETPEFELLGSEFESGKISKEVSDLLFHYEKQKMSMIQRQILEEKTLVQDLNQKIEQNITKFINLEARLREKQEQLEDEIKIKTRRLVETERLAAISELSSRLAHDLKNPLSVIKVTLDLVKWASQNTNDPNFLHRVDAVNTAIFRMTHQIDNVMNFLGDVAIEKQETAIQEILKLTLNKLPKRDGLTLNIPAQDLSLICDKQKMVIVFTNILLNSMQAVGESGTVSVRFQKIGSNVVIEFEDSGNGIAETILPRIFDPLFTTKQEGTGLGLATCKNIIKQHGGTITVKNSPTTFTVTLPQVK